MAPEISDLRMMAQRLEKLERQNRRLMQVGSSGSGCLVLSRVDGAGSAQAPPHRSGQIHSKGPDAERNGRN